MKAIIDEARLLFWGTVLLLVLVVVTVLERTSWALYRLAQRASGAIGR